MATRRGTLRAAAVVAGGAVWPGLARAAPADGDSASLLLAVLVGAGIALGSALLVLRRRERAAAQPAHDALAASCAFWWRADSSGRIVAIEPGRLAGGLDVERLRGRLVWELAKDPAPGEELKDAVRAGRPFSGISCSPTDTIAAPLALSGGPVLSDAGALLGFAGVAQPGLTMAGASVQDAGALQRDLELVRVELVERTRQLEHATRELDSFAYSVSHDLRAPLRVVDGFATIVLEDYGDRGKPLDDVGRDHLRRIVAASQRMNSMIETLLGLARMTSRELVRERVDLSQVARELAEDLRSQDGTRQVEFAINPDLRADGDPTLLRLVLQNLLGNAYKFTAKNASARIEVGARTEGGNVAYYVKDNGAGFDMRFAEKMFGLFQRLHSANEFPGTGVGLATVQKIVRRHGGRVWAEAVPAPNAGHGATFYFTLWEKAT